MIAAVLVGGGLGAALGIAAVPESVPPDKEPKKARFTLVSPAFEEGGSIPEQYGCGPERNPRKPSIPLAWYGAPEGTRSFVLVMDDPHPAARDWVHWLVIDLPATLSSLPAGASGAMDRGANERPNSWGEIGYGGPCPPEGSHPYVLRLYARPEARSALDLDGKRGEALHALLRDSLGTATLSGVFP